ncbi:phosphotriesterase [Amycolatopsis sp. FDAARGOS 1241]|uniref:phosphotriesterase family protein n=1 Tax=Amycolatopsis sp. FDAARGOS 1241 TaxID=2778070 RepID=UPI001EF24670|nr:phosphotriesterase [Amycolatopsis sp. FDAARGOS 1241]
MPGDPRVRTVLGDVEPAELEVCDSHDHLFFASRLLPGQELDDVAAAEAELRAFAAAGGRAVVQWTPFGLNRRTADLVALSAVTGVHVVAATGFHRAEHYPPALVDRVADRLAELFVSDLFEGTPAGDEPDAERTGPRAGLIKVAGAFHVVDRHARWTMVAAAQAHHETGAPIAVHLELGTAAREVADLLCGELAVPPSRVILGHLNRNPDPRVLREVAATGVYLGFDGPSRANHATDWRLTDLLYELVTAGHTAQLLLGGDTTTAAARFSSGGGPGIPYLLTTLRPRLTRALGADAVESMLHRNPARAFAARWRR